ncbi:hypothetical protein GCM10011339_20460 [Echinicola rosea]|uniref:Uncharacterized protein n=2 Tax=Echinicola rosea TaxID=1807691 RepID=A0ABQ1UZS7_9BACT|nr:hypothetical protein GCM10011339_20460 [Echinicola rosea]
MILGTLTWTSCQENGQEEPLMTEHEEVGSTETNPMDHQAYEKQLEELSLYMGEVMKDPEARAELFGFGKLKGNSGEISSGYYLKRDKIL